MANDERSKNVDAAQKIKLSLFTRFSLATPFDGKINSPKRRDCYKSNIKTKNLKKKKRKTRRL